MAMALGKPNRLHKWLKVMNLEKGQEERVDWYVGDEAGRENSLNALYKCMQLSNLKLIKKYSK